MTHLSSQSIWLHSQLTTLCWPQSKRKLAKCVCIKWLLQNACIFLLQLATCEHVVPLRFPSHVLVPQISYSDTKVPVLVVMECKHAVRFMYTIWYFYFSTSRSTECTCKTPLTKWGDYSHILALFICTFITMIAC